MFEDSLFASTARPNRRSGWAAVFTFALEAVVLGVFVLVPMLYTDALPISTLKGYVELPPPPGRAAPPQPIHQQAARPRQSDIRDGIVVQPRSIPQHVAQIVDQPDATAAYDGPGIVGMPDGIGRSSPLISSIIGHANSNIAPPAISHPSVIRLSGGVTEGFLIHKITPAYPKIAIIAHQQGSVILEATIGRDGTIQNLRAITGPPMLIGAAIEAVKQWRYKPYLLNNEPVDVETQITVNFTLGG